MDQVTQLDAAISTLVRVLLIQERRTSNDISATPFNPLDLETLSFLSRHAGVTAKEIATYLQVSPTTMQSVVDRLKKRGLVTKDNSLLKGRGIAISLTANGVKLRDLMQAQNTQNCKSMLGAIDPLDRERFVDSMTKIAAKIVDSN